MSKKLTTEEFIEKARLIHGDKYDYSKVEYKNVMTKVCIICPIHGEFYQMPYSHLNGNGCSKCALILRGNSNKLTQEEFIEKARQVHGDKYDYSKVQYKNNKTKVCIICREHGEFWQTPNSHLNGCGCSKCGTESTINYHRLTTESFIEKAVLIHGDKYDYSKVDYINSLTKVCIICKEHGEFWQPPHDHLKGKVCPKCSFINCYNKLRFTTKEFIERAKLVHGDKYDYSKVEYINTHTKVCIICLEHGKFWQSPSDHLQGKSCPKCKQSILENEIEKILSDNNIVYIQQKRFKWLGRQSLDFYIPKHLGIECQGEQHFVAKEYFGGEKNFILQQERDKKKKQLCEENDIKLLYYTNLTKYDTFLGEKLYKDKEELLKEILT